MKRFIRMILIVTMAATICCTAGLAEETADGGTALFLQIPKGITAQVYLDDKGEEPADTLEGGSLCALISEKMTDDILWEHVFYLNGKKEGTTGYINSAAVKKLSQEELQNLLTDPDQVNKILDLVDALDAYTAGASQPNIPVRNDAQPKENTFETLYSAAVETLGKIFNNDFSGTLEKAKDAAGNLAEQAKAEIEEKVPGAIETVEKLGQQVKEATKPLQETAEKLGQQVNEATKPLQETVGDLVQKAGNEISDKLPENMKDAMKKLEQLKDKVSDTIDSMKDGGAEEKMKELMNRVTEATDSLKNNSGEQIEKVQNEMGKMIDSLGSKLNGETMEEISNLTKEADKMMQSTEFQNAMKIVNKLSGSIQTGDETGGLQIIKNLVDLIPEV